MKSTILIVEDDFASGLAYKNILEGEGFIAEHVMTGHDAMERIEIEPPDLVLLDILLPAMDGLEVCRRVRARGDYIPIIMITFKGEEVDRIVGLELGADDYMTKPISGRELIARVRAVLRLARKRAGAVEAEERLVIDDRLQIDLAGRAIWVDGQPMHLTPKEFDLLALMASHRGRVFGREMLLERIWGYDFLGDSRTVDVHIQRLRKKIEPDPQHPSYIMTIRTIGYKFSKAT
jgi:two-component system alkaline phosphatase synthesis response regulator PhoP